MKILVTNDEGIYAKGLWVLVEELRKRVQVIVVAPDREQSGVGTAVTLHLPLRIKEVTPLVPGVEAYSVEGTPADSVILALQRIAKDSVDIVISGINEGPNLGSDVFISGTVGAALQGYFYGLPSLALSVSATGDVHFGAAARLAGLLAGKIEDKTLSGKFLLNINLPDLPTEEIKGVEVTQLAGRSYADLVQEGHDGRRSYYWIVRGEPQWQNNERTDIWALRKSSVSITPFENNPATGSVHSPLERLCPSLLHSLHHPAE